MTKACECACASVLPRPPAGWMHPIPCLCGSTLRITSLVYTLAQTGLSPESDGVFVFPVSLARCMVPNT